MLDQFLQTKILNSFSFTPTEEQQVLIRRLAAFLTSRQRESVFLLKGYAGTGKTSVVSALVKTLIEMEQKIVLLAPTGRAAKVLTHYSGQPAQTIHKHIYRQKSAVEMTFVLDNNLQPHTLFIVDEASMIANYTGDGMLFGTGQLLDDLLHFVFSAEGCSLILLGDTAQLPPVMQPVSPALDEGILQSFGLNVSTFTLTQVVRQAVESGILYNATLLRQKVDAGVWPATPRFRLAFPDVKRLPGDELIDTIQSAYSHSGLEESIVITRSNKRANLYNNGIRNRVLMKEEELATGDLLMVVKNNYFWSKTYAEMDFIANGDIVEIRRILRHHELYGFRFADVLVRFLDYDCEMEARVLLDVLQADSPARMDEMSRKLFQAVSEDYVTIGNRRERAKQMQKDPFLNALQVKFAYAVTCHKAQGGQWQIVFVDQGMVADDQLNADYYRWLYTAFTRATGMIYLVNFPDHFFAKENDAMES
ncbi:ATP-dependent DNA helicase [Microbacter margulisiae]|uniref:Exodeoxyribonuclease-5 n=1 Tax=Microbacter margulisiae TaxID=1350067 RepID=A0A7W5H2Z8_9PORP|nr:AAA family ATPase [Microbacter margulisiae]MBB3187907.1 exodeoxyribonuclease-5 [Microbacter margulisiae]